MALDFFAGGDERLRNWAWFLEYLYHTGRMEPPQRYTREAPGPLIEAMPEQWRPV